jgi:hypothetical protein
MSHDVTTSKFPGNADENSNTKTMIGPPRPLAAVRQYCLECCIGSALEVRNCADKSCPLWAYRFGRKPSPQETDESQDTLMAPEEIAVTVGDFLARGGTGLKAIKRRCLDCSGFLKGAVRTCHRTTCPLYPFRFGKNPNRTLSGSKREAAVARMRRSGAKRRHMVGAGDRSAP